MLYVSGSGANPAFINSGTFRKTAGPGTQTQIQVPFQNTGTVQASSGRLSFGGGGGPVRFGAGATVAAGAGTVEFYGLQADGASTIASGARVELRDDPSAGRDRARAP